MIRQRVLVFFLQYKPNVKKNWFYTTIIQGSESSVGLFTERSTVENSVKCYQIQCYFLACVCMYTMYVIKRLLVSDASWHHLSYESYDDLTFHMYEDRQFNFLIPRLHLRLGSTDNRRVTFRPYPIINSRYSRATGVSRFSLFSRVDK